MVASAHMTIFAAKVAGVPKVIACTPGSYAMPGDRPDTGMGQIYLSND